MATNTSKKLKTHAIFSVTLVVALIAVLATASFSWFVMRDDNKINEFRVGVSKSLNLSLVDDGGTDDDIVTNWGESFTLKPIWGDARDFFVPEYQRAEVVAGSGVYDDLPTGNYLSIDNVNDYAFVMEFGLSINSYVDLYLDFTTETYSRVTVCKGSKVRKSAYGDFSRDYIIGATRVAIFEEDVLKMVWIPNSTIQLVELEDGTCELLTDGEVEQSYTFLKQNQTTFSIETNGQPNGNVIVDDVVYVWGDITSENCPTITTFIGQKQFRAITWVDGNDRECTNALVGGKINVNLCFGAKEREVNWSKR